MIVRTYTGFQQSALIMAQRGDNPHNPYPFSDPLRSSWTQQRQSYEDMAIAAAIGSSYEPKRVACIANYLSTLAAAGEEGLRTGNYEDYQDELNNLMAHGGGIIEE